MDQVSKTKRLAELHAQSTPLVLYNIWDAGSAKAVAAAGAPAVATSSWEVAKAQGYEDGQDIPLELAEPTPDQTRVVATALHWAMIWVQKS